MKYTFLLVIYLFSLIYGFGQNNEFEVHPKGLMYSEGTMNELHRIVEDLNLQFAACELDRVYLSNAQSTGHYLEIEARDLEQVMKDMKDNVSLDYILKTYKIKKLDENLLLVRFKSRFDEENYFVRGLTLDEGYDYSLGMEESSTADNSHWVMKRREGNKHKKKHIAAFFLHSAFESKSLPEIYARKIQYSNCMIDTTEQKFSPEAEQGEYTSLPDDYHKLPRQEQEKLLKEFRDTRVVGYCSMDSSPRLHAMNIAKLAATTANWNIFLRAHLDIMNDRFPRMSDGNYAWASRKTYIRELEELAINVPDLLTGISLKFENASKNHYYGSIGRIGRALSESLQQEEMKEQLLTMIGDTELDDYNRVAMYYLFQNYNMRLNDPCEQKKNVAELKTAIQSMPDYIATRLELKTDDCKE